MKKLNVVVIIVICTIMFVVTANITRANYEEVPTLTTQEAVQLVTQADMSAFTRVMEPELIQEMMIAKSSGTPAEYMEMYLQLQPEFSSTLEEYYNIHIK